MFLLKYGLGIGGTSVAYYLSEQVKSTLDVTIIDSGIVGGRLATTVIAGREYETGGSIIHPANRELIYLNNNLFIC